MSTPRVLVAGIGNIFFGDDAFGVRVAQRLATRAQHKDVRVVDFGIRGLDLGFALLDGYEAVILIDAVARGGTPGTLYVIEPEWDDTPAAEASAPMLEAHSMDPVKVLRFAASLGATVDRVLMVGCEPRPTTDSADMEMQMSEPVRAAVDEAVSMIETLIARVLNKCADAGTAEAGDAGGRESNSVPDSTF